MFILYNKISEFSSLLLHYLFNNNCFFFPTCFYIVTVTLYLQIDCLSRAEVKVSHCPAAAMRMLGFAPIREMMDAGICVSLGTDGAPSNNRMSIGPKFLSCLASFINLNSHYQKKKSCFSILAYFFLTFGLCIGNSCMDLLPLQLMRCTWLL